MNDLLKFESVAVERYAAGTWTNGKYTKGAKTDISIFASVQPADGREIDQLPEGDRTKVHKEIFSTSELKLNDIITYDGERYEVHKLSDWSPYCTQHFEAMAVRIEEQ